MSGAINFAGNNEYYTPAEFVRNLVGVPDYDPATIPKKAREFGVADYDTKETDGLKRDWAPFRKIWINPPFTKKLDFLRKAVDTFLECGNEIWFLCPISFLTTQGFNREAKRCGGGSLYLPNGRIAFENDGGKVSPAFGSVVFKIGGESRIIFINTKGVNE